MKTNIRQVNIKNRKLVKELNELLSDTEYYFEYEYEYNNDNKYLTRLCSILLFVEGEYEDGLIEHYGERKKNIKPITLERVLTFLYRCECYELSLKPFFNDLAIYRASVYRTIHDTIVYGKEYKRMDSNIKQVGDTNKRLKI